MAPSGLQSPPNTPASPSTLAGGTSPGSTDSGSPAGSPEAPDQAGGEGANSALRSSVQKLRTFEMEMVELAGRFPAAAPSLRAAVTSVRAALRQIIANPGQPEPRAPSVGG